MTHHVTMFSSGAGSWAAARRVQDTLMQPGDKHTLLFSDVSMEDEDNYRFLTDAAEDIGAELITLADGRDIWQVFKDERFLGNSRLASCSKLLKQKPARLWLDKNCDPRDTVVYVGIDWTETHRVQAIERAYMPYVARAPLTTPPLLSREDVLAAMDARGLVPPRLYGLGFAHANCGGGCVRAGQGQFVQLLRTLPDRYAWWEEQEQELRDYLGKDVAILRDRAAGRDEPLTLRDLRERVASRGEQLDLFELGGCGCFVDG